MQFRILGPLEVAELDRTVPLGGAQQRAVLAVLLLRRREVVSTDRLIDELWGGRPPATALKTVQGYVSHLRKALGADLLITQGRGYLLAAEGHRALEAGEARRASALLDEALALWRGPPLADLAYESFAQAEIGRLEELRLAALEERIDADVALGRHDESIGELEPLIAEHPLRERLRGLLML